LKTTNQQDNGNCILKFNSEQRLTVSAKNWLIGKLRIMMALRSTVCFFAVLV